MITRIGHRAAQVLAPFIVIVAAYAITSSSSPPVVFAAQPATQPADESRDPLLIENQRLREALRKAQARVEDQNRQIALLSRQVYEVHKERTPSTNPVTPEAGLAAVTAARVRSYSNLRMIGGALIFFANSHDQQGPKTLEELRLASDIPSAAFQSPLLNTRYHYVHYDNRMKGTEVVAYEETDDPYPSILFGDGSVETLPAAQVAKIVADGHK